MPFGGASIAAPTSAATTTPRLGELAGSAALGSSPTPESPLIAVVTSPLRAIARTPTAVWAMALFPDLTCVGVESSAHCGRVR